MDWIKLCTAPAWFDDCNRPQQPCCGVVAMSSRCVRRHLLSDLFAASFFLCRAAPRKADQPGDLRKARSTNEPKYSINNRARWALNTYEHHTTEQLWRKKMVAAALPIGRRRTNTLNSQLPLQNQSQFYTHFAYHSMYIHKSTIFTFTHYEWTPFGGQCERVWS